MSKPQTSKPQNENEEDIFEAKAKDFLDQAEAAVNGFEFLGNKKKQKGIELYQKAASHFKLAGEHEEAAKALLCAAQWSERIKKEFEATQFYTEAAKCYKEVDNKESINTFRLAIRMHMEQNRFQSAAKIWRAIAKIYEIDKDFKGAIEAYEEAANCFEAEDQTAHLIDTRLKIAHFAAERGEFKKSVELLEKVAEMGMVPGSSLSRFQVPEYLYKASLLQLVICVKYNNGNMADARTAVTKYARLCPQYDRSSKMELVQNLIAAYDADKVDKFTDILFKFDQRNKLDNWSSKLLLIVKKSMQREKLDISLGDGLDIDLGLDKNEDLELDGEGVNLDVADSKEHKTEQKYKSPPSSTTATTSSQKPTTDKSTTAPATATATATATAKTEETSSDALTLDDDGVDLK